MANNSLLLLTALIWGFAFVAQRAGMESVGPFIFNGLRFSLGVLSLLPVLLIARRRGDRLLPAGGFREIAAWAAAAGAVLFAGASLQQVGIVSTTAGKAGFITGLYVVLVPLFGAACGTRSGVSRWSGAVLALLGLYLISVDEALSVGGGDFLVLLCAVFFAIHVLLLSRISPRFHPVPLSMIQYGVCALLSLLFSLGRETTRSADLAAVWLPILYGGVFSVGIAYSLQVAAQRKAHPTHAAIILSLEGLFAAVGGFLLLGERFTGRELAGAVLMLSGMILSQFSPGRGKGKA